MPDNASHSARAGLGVAAMVAGMAVLAGTDATSKHLTATYAVAQIMWVRYVLFAGFGAALAWRRAGRRGFGTRRPAMQAARALALVGTNFVFVTALSRMGMAEAHAIIAVGPLIVTAASVPFLGETVGPRRWIAVAAGFAGVLVVLRPGIGVFDPAALIPLAAAGSFAVYILLTRALARHDPQETTLFHTGWIGLVAVSAVAPFVWTAPDAAGWFWLLVAGITGTLAHALIVLALHLAPASAVQPFNYTALAWAALLGWLAFGDIPDGWTLAGASIVVASGLYAWRRETLAARAARRR